MATLNEQHARYRQQVMPGSFPGGVQRYISPGRYANSSESIFPHRQLRPGEPTSPNQQQGGVNISGMSLLRSLAEYLRQGHQLPLDSGNALIQGGQTKSPAFSLFPERREGGQTNPIFAQPEGRLRPPLPETDAQRSAALQRQRDRGNQPYVSMPHPSFSQLEESMRRYQELLQNRPQQQMQLPGILGQLVELAGIAKAQSTPQLAASNPPSPYGSIW